MPFQPSLTMVILILHASVSKSIQRQLTVSVPFYMHLIVFLFPFFPAVSDELCGHKTTVHTVCAVELLRQLRYIGSFDMPDWKYRWPETTPINYMHAQLFKGKRLQVKTWPIILPPQFLV
jgi:hypothetical protein